MQQENLPTTIKQKKTIIKNMFRVKKIHVNFVKLYGTLGNLAYR